MTAHEDLVKAEQALNQLTPVVVDITDKARSLATITDDPSFQEADNFLVEIKRTQKRLEEERKKYTAPLDLAKKQIMDAYRPKANLLAEAEMILKGATRKWYLAEQDRNRKEEQRRMEEERKKQEEAKIEKAVELEKHGNKAQAEAVLDSPTTVAKPKVSTSFDSGNSYGRKVYKVEIRNLFDFLVGIAQGKVSPEFIEIKTAKMERVATTLKGKVEWPGVKVVEDVVMGVRR